MENSSNRRDFIRKAGLGIAGLGFMSDQLAAASIPQHNPIKKVELAIATITMDGFGDHNFEKAFQILPQLPFKNIEFNCWYGRTLTPNGIRNIKEKCTQLGLTPVCVQGSSFGAEGNIVKDVAHKLWNIQAAKELECRRVKFTGASRGKEGGLDAVISCLKEIAPAAEELDVLILVENHANNNIETIEDYHRIFEAVDSTHVGMCMDNAHFDGSNVNLLEVVETFHSKILHIDLKDTEKYGIHKVVNYGEGVTQNDAVVKKMLEYNYEGYLLIEMAPPRNESTLVQDLNRAYDLFQKYER
jgi:sugar phosphate isomerase/epimerase